MTQTELQALLDSTPLMMGVAWAVVIPAIISALGMLKGSGGGAADANAMMTPEMRDMMNIQRLRMQQQQPLYNDVMGMARGLLPTRYRLNAFGGTMPPPGNGQPPYPGVPSPSPLPGVNPPVGPVPGGPMPHDPTQPGGPTPPSY